MTVNDRDRGLRTFDSIRRLIQLAKCTRRYIEAFPRTPKDDMAVKSVRKLLAEADTYLDGIQLA